MANSDIVVNIGIEGTGKVKSELDGIGQSAQNSSKKAKTAFSELGNELKGSFVSAIKSAIVAYAGFEVINKTIGYLKSARQEYQDSVAAQLRLTTGLGFTSRALNEQANALSDKLVVDNDEITRVQAMIANYVKNEEQVKRLTPAVLDLAAATGQDMASAANIIARAIADDSDELGKYRIQVEGARGSNERITSVIEGLNRNFNGQAVAVAAAKDGWDAFGKTSKDILEKVGSSDLLQGAGLAFSQWAKGVKVIVDNVFTGTVDASTNAINQLNAVKNQSDIILGVMKDRDKIFEQVSMQTFQGRVALYAKQYEELREQAVKANDVIAADSLNALYYGPNGIITKEKEAENKRLSDKQALIDQDKLVQTDNVNWLNNLMVQEKENEVQLFQEAQQEKLDSFNSFSEDFEKNENLRLTKAITAEKAYQLTRADGVAIALDGLKRLTAGHKEFFALYKAAAISQAISDAYRSYNLAIATIPPPFGFIAGGLNFAAGLANAASIASQKFARGGVSNGGCAMVGEEGPEMMYLPSGARVYNSNETRNMTTNNNNAVTVNVLGSNGQVVETLRASLRSGSGDNFVRDLKQALSVA